MLFYACFWQFFSHLNFAYKSVREINQIYYLFNKIHLEGWLFSLQANFSLWHDLLISVSVLLGLLLMITLDIYEPVIPHDFLIKIIWFHPLRKQQRRQTLLYFGQCMFFLLTFEHELSDHRWGWYASAFTEVLLNYSYNCGCQYWTISASVLTEVLM